MCNSYLDYSLYLHLYPFWLLRFHNDIIHKVNGGSHWRWKFCSLSRELFLIFWINSFWRLLKRRIEGLCTPNSLTYSSFALFLSNRTRSLLSFLFIHFIAKLGNILMMNIILKHIMYFNEWHVCYLSKVLYYCLWIIYSCCLSSCLVWKSEISHRGQE